MSPIASRLLKRALQENLEKKHAFVPLDKAAQQAMGPDGAPVDPAASMDPAAAGAPMDPAAAGAAPGAAPMDPAAGAMPPAGAPPVDPAAASGGAAPDAGMAPPIDAGLPPPSMDSSSTGEKAVTGDEAEIVMNIVERTLEAVGKKKTPGQPAAGGAPAPDAPPPMGPITGMPGDISAMAGDLAGMPPVAGAPKTAAVLAKKYAEASPLTETSPYEPPKSTFFGKAQQWGSAAKDWLGKPGMTGISVGGAPISRGAEIGVGVGTIAAGALLAHLLRKKKPARKVASTADILGRAFSSK